MKEIVTILSGVVSLICVTLMFFAVSSYMARAVSTLTVCVVGLTLLGILFKVCGLIFKPILALSNISLIGAVDQILGAVMGAAEAFLLSCALYIVLDRLGIYVL